MTQLHGKNVTFIVENLKMASPEGTAWGLAPPFVLKMVHSCPILIVPLLDDRVGTFVRESRRDGLPIARHEMPGELSRVSQSRRDG